jgi:hypothetical protein
MRTKWDILVERQQQALEAYTKATQTLTDLVDTPFTANGTGQCSKCGTPLPTEADFAKHFLVSNESFLNLGYYPNA